MDKITSPHDRFFKGMLSGPVPAGNFLRRFLPEPVAATLDLEALEPVPTSFVDPKLAWHFSDLVFEARRVDGRAAYVYCLIDHKSYLDPLVGLQLLDYMVRLWDHMLQQQKKQKKLELPLAPIIPLVFYHGGRRWNVSPDFTDLIAVSDAPDHCTPRFRYLLVDLNAEADEGVEDDPILAVTLAAFRYAFNRKVQTLAWIVTLLSAVQQTRRGREALSMVLRYLSSIGVPERELRRAAERAFPREGEQIMRGFLDETFDEGVEQGLQQGLQEGLQQGAVATAQGFLLDVLEARFGGAPGPIVAHIYETQDVPALKAWLKIATTSGSIEDFVAALSKTAG